MKGKAKDRVHIKKLEKEVEASKNVNIEIKRKIECMKIEYKQDDHMGSMVDNVMNKMTNDWSNQLQYKKLMSFVLRNESDRVRHKIFAGDLQRV